MEELIACLSGPLPRSPGPRNQTSPGIRFQREIEVVLSTAALMSALESIVLSIALESIISFTRDLAFSRLKVENERGNFTF